MRLSAYFSMQYYTAGKLINKENLSVDSVLLINSSFQ